MNVGEQIANYIDEQAKAMGKAPGGAASAIGYSVIFKKLKHIAMPLNPIR